MHDTFRVQILDTINELHEIPMRQAHVHSKVGLDAIEQLTTRRILEHDVELIELLERRDVLDDVHMTERLVNEHFFLNRRSVFE